MAAAPRHAPIRIEVMPTHRPWSQAGGGDYIGGSAGSAGGCPEVEVVVSPAATSVAVFRTADKEQTVMSGNRMLHVMLDSNNAQPSGPSPRGPAPQPERKLRT